MKVAYPGSEPRPPMPRCQDRMASEWEWGVEVNEWVCRNGGDVLHVTQVEQLDRPTSSDTATAAARLFAASSTAPSCRRSSTKT